MKCPECLKVIYLLDELSKTERKNVDHHLRDCQSCRQAYQKLEADRKVLRKAFAGPVHSDDALLTRRIMASVRNMENREPSRIDWVFPPLQWRPVRYSLAMASVVLVLFFIREQMPTTPAGTSLTFIKPMEKLPDVELNSSLFHEQIKERLASDKAKQVPSFNLFDCINACKRNEDLARCEECKVTYSKFKLYEDI